MIIDKVGASGVSTCKTDDKVSVHKEETDVEAEPLLC